MDAEGIKAVLSILVWGGLFFFMMRFGCGAHMMGGHGHHGGHDDSADPADKTSKDPVCGMAVDRQKTTPASTYLGKTYYFCSDSCHDKFEREPKKYASDGTSDTKPQEGHHHG